MYIKGESILLNAATKNSPHVKLLATFDYDDDRKDVSVFNVGINTTGNWIIDAVQYIKYTLQVRNTACGLKVYIHNQYTDDGRGGTWEDLRKKLKEVGRVDVELDWYYGVTCSLHILHFTLYVPVESCMDLGGIESQNMMQLLSIAYNLSQNYLPEERRQKLMLVTGE